MPAMVLDQAKSVEEGPLAARELGAPEPGQGEIRVGVWAGGVAIAWVDRSAERSPTKPRSYTCESSGTL